MIQRMINHITINIPDLDLTTAEDITVTFEQRTSGTPRIVELTYSGDSVVLSDEHTINVTMPKEDAMKLDHTPVRGQVMFTINGVPTATKVFTASVDELLKEDGYGD